MTHKCLSALLLIPALVHAQVLYEGKTKQIKVMEGNASHVLICSKDDITGNDGAMHDVIKGKAAIATDTTCNVFRLLKECGVPVAFTEQTSNTEFTAPKCEMIQYEVVARREAHGSYLKRNPHMRKGHYFPRLVVEFFLKTTGKKWGNYSLPFEDPYIQFRDGKAYLYNPKQPIWEQEPFLGLDEYPLQGQDNHFMKIIEHTARTFLILEKAWQLAGGTLVDFKLEFGFDTQGNLLLADVVDNDSWRVLQDGEYIDKQFYRDGGDLNAVTKKYCYVRDRTAEFRLPKQQIIIWRGSEKDNVEPFINALKPFMGNEIQVNMVTCSMHKDPVTGYKNLMRAVQNIPDCVVVAFIGRSNGAGPTLSANTLVPTITVPMGWKDFPEDVWSSLRAPSNVPVMTMLDQENAALAAMQILAKRNPRVYAQLQMQTMSRLQNFIDL